MEDFIVSGCEPILEMSGFFLPDGITVVADDKFIFPYESGVSSKYHIGQTSPGLHQRHVHMQSILKEIIEHSPLLLGKKKITLTTDTHPGIDLVLNSVIQRRTHQERGCLPTAISWMRRCQIVGMANDRAFQNAAPFRALTGNGAAKKIPKESTPQVAAFPGART
jgi:hypothetical protein